MAIRNFSNRLPEVRREQLARHWKQIEPLYASDPEELLVRSVAGLKLFTLAKQGPVSEFDVVLSSVYNNSAEKYETSLLFPWHQAGLDEKLNFMHTATSNPLIGHFPTLRCAAVFSGI